MTLELKYLVGRVLISATWVAWTELSWWIDSVCETNFVLFEIFLRKD